MKSGKIKELRKKAKTKFYAKTRQTRSKSSKPISIYIPCPNPEVAIRISKHLLHERLIACSNIFPVRSMYWWESRVLKDQEFVILAKSIDTNYKKIISEAKKHHPYDVPLIAKFNIEVNKEYLQWLKKETLK
ncbi:MAG: divalent-cation tolerance protein CutA [Candidatus Woesearchaeota archaeon]